MWVRNASAEVDQHSKYAGFVCTCAITTSIMIGAVSLRAYDRGKSSRISVDDWVTFVSAAFAVIYAALAVEQTRLGLGLPLALRPPENLHNFTRLNYAGRPIYIAALATFKIAACLGALKIVKGTNRRTLRILIKLSMVFIVVSHIAIALALMLYCRPVEKAWNPHILGTCLPPGPLFYGTAGVSIICDLIAFSLPLTALYPIRIVNRDKGRLVVLLFFGFLTTVCSIVRMIQTRTVVEKGDSTNLILWGVIETCVGVITSSTPTFNGMISAMRKKGASSSNSSHNTGTYRELPGAGGKASSSVELDTITRTMMIKIESTKKQDGLQDTTTTTLW